MPVPPLPPRVWGLRGTAWIRLCSVKDGGATPSLQELFRLHQRQGIVDAVTNHRHFTTYSLQLRDVRCFIFRQDFGDDLIQLPLSAPLLPQCADYRPSASLSGHWPRAGLGQHDGHYHRFCPSPRHTSPLCHVTPEDAPGYATCPYKPPLLLFRTADLGDFRERCYCARVSVLNAPRARGSPHSFRRSYCGHARLDAGIPSVSSSVSDR